VILLAEIDFLLHGRVGAAAAFDFSGPWSNRSSSWFPSSRPISFVLVKC
jgi:hypothetical protein